LFFADGSGYGGASALADLKRDLTQGSVARALVRYSVPLVSSSLLQAMYSIADLMVAGILFLNPTTPFQRSTT